MIEINLETFLKELSNYDYKEPIKMLLRGFCSTNHKSMIIIFDNICYYITNKIQKISYKEHQEISSKYIMRTLMNKGDNNWQVFTNFMNNNFKLYNYPEFII